MYVSFQRECSARRWVVTAPTSNQCYSSLALCALRLCLIYEETKARGRQYICMYVNFWNSEVALARKLRVQKKRRTELAEAGPYGLFAQKQKTAFCFCAVRTRSLRPRKKQKAGFAFCFLRSAERVMLQCTGSNCGFWTHSTESTICPPFTYTYLRRYMYFFYIH